MECEVGMVISTCSLLSLGLLWVLKISPHPLLARVKTSAPADVDPRFFYFIWQNATSHPLMEGRKNVCEAGEIRKFIKK